MQSLVQRHDKLCSVAACELHRLNVLPWCYSHLVRHHPNDDMQHSFILALLVPADLLSSSHWPAFKLPTVKRVLVGASVTRSLVSLLANVYVRDTHARIYTTITFSMPNVCPRHDYRYQSRTCVAPAVHTAHDTVILGQGLFMVLLFSHHQCNSNWLY